MSGTTTMQQPVTRAVALCASDRPICPRCGKPVLGRMEIMPQGTFATCVRSSATTARAKDCGQIVYILPCPGNVCAVVAITSAEFSVIRRRDQSAKEVLRDLGVLAGAVADAERKVG